MAPSTILPCTRRLFYSMSPSLVPLLLSTLVLAALSTIGAGYNLSPEASLVYEDPNWTGPGSRESYFGFSVGLRSRKQHSDTWLMVGAPRANFSSPLAPVGIKEPGVIYKCPINGGSECEQLIVDLTGNMRQNLHDGERAYHDYKDYGWLGASIDTQPSNRETTMVCGPLWKNQIYQNTLLMNGVCYSQDSGLTDGTALKLLPLTRISLQNYRTSQGDTVYHYGFGQVGMSVHFPEGNSTVLVGAPGIFNWQGSVVQMKDPVYVDPGAPERRRRKRRQLRFPQISYFSTAFTPNPYFTSSLKDSNYFGYSVSSGEFVKGETHYVAGAPRGANSTGKVLVFQMGQTEESPLDILVERNGKQIGEYFGAAVTAADFNGDGLAELVVGAPFRSQNTVPDHGVVYVYTNLGRGQVNIEAVMLEGMQEPSARFGSAVISPGDLDWDGFNDLLVGAPYEGGGAVYLYLGSANGIQRAVSQRIAAEEFNTLANKPLTGFGFSLSRGVDVDDNRYPDVAVGSYSSGHAVVVRTRPVAVLEGTTTTTPSRLTITDDGFSVRACVSFSGIGVPQKEDVTVLLTLDHERQLPVPRASFIDTGTREVSYNVTLLRDSRKCVDYRVRMQSEFSNAKDPVGVRIQYWLSDTSLLPSERTKGPRDFGANRLGPITSPVTDPTKRTGVTSFVGIVTGCEDDGDDSCRSDLKVTAWYPGFGEGSPLIIGKQKRVKLAVKIENHGEPAFLPQIRFSVHRPLDLMLPSTHTCERLGTDYPSVMCRLNNPLLKGQGNEDKIEIEIDVERLSDSSPPLMVNVTTSSSSDIEVTPADNNFNSPLQLAADLKLQLHGSSSPEQVTYDRSSTSVINMTNINSLSFMHEHTIVKRGPTPLGEVRLYVEIPVRDEHNNTLLTVHAPETDFRGQTFPCVLSGASWVTKKKGTGENATNISDKPDEENSNRRRRQAHKEATDVVESKMGEGGVEGRSAVPLVNCRELLDLKCATMTCNISSWPHDSASATLKFRLDLNLTTLAGIITVKDGTTIATEATAVVKSLDQSIAFEGKRSAKGSARSTVLPGSLQHEGISWWWYLLAVIVGLLLLSALMYGLSKIGFFRRKEQEEMKALTATVSKGMDD